MYVDNNTVLSDSQAVTVTAASTNVYDCGVANRAIGDGEDIQLVVPVKTTFTAAGAATMAVALQDSADNATFADVVTSPAIAVATLVAGYEALRIRLPFGLRRYLRVNYTVATGPMTAGALYAFFAKDRQANQAQASGFTVL